jgi:hypothetical protein
VGTPPSHLAPQQHQVLLAESGSTPTISSVPADSDLTSTSTPMSTWFLDFGASTHVTQDINSLSYSQPYQGHDIVQIGNDAGLYIFHIGITNLCTKSALLKLTNILHVPQISKNLLSVSQLTKDNNVYDEF